MLDESSRDRYYMWQAGLDMVLERPLFGQGPGMVEVYPRFRWPEAPNPRSRTCTTTYAVAAERGLPGLVFFLWWVGSRSSRASRSAAAASSGRGPALGGRVSLAALSAVVVAGLFEYNSATPRC